MFGIYAVTNDRVMKWGSSEPSWAFVYSVSGKLQLVLENRDVRSTSTPGLG
jgi:hypothetical protein